MVATAVLNVVIMVLCFSNFGPLSSRSSFYLLKEKSTNVDDV